MKNLKTIVATLFSMLALVAAINANASELNLKNIRVHNVKCSVQQNQQSNHAPTCHIFNSIFEDPQSQNS